MPALNKAECFNPLAEDFLVARASLPSVRVRSYRELNHRVFPFLSRSHRVTKTCNSGLYDFAAFGLDADGSLLWKYQVGPQKYKISGGGILEVPADEGRSRMRGRATAQVSGSHGLRTLFCPPRSSLPTRRILHISLQRSQV